MRETSYSALSLFFINKFYNILALFIRKSDKGYLPVTVIYNTLYIVHYVQLYCQVAMVN